VNGLFIFGLINTRQRVNPVVNVPVKPVLEAKRLLTSPEYKNETILEVIFKSGFNSPSAFHRFFKRMVTPTEYRKQAKVTEG
jgi:methylphosphotriester-DNA--protein-cysteine methyltransferase